MRKLQSSISSVVNVAVLCGGVLIVCVEDVRSLCANFLSTLRIAASYLGIIANDALWRVSGTKWLKAMKCPAHCTATAMQHQRHRTGMHRRLLSTTKSV